MYREATILSKVKRRMWGNEAMVHTVELPCNGPLSFADLFKGRILKLSVVG